ncbi:PEP-CTERM sorting domain-containing protein [Mucisphaera calidilacus]|uniref:PEP-CTERM protein-sorting domain-containing protein n=1 Tax=Mucisphaera calidilacus TaxID=2527982 RepID=A0A518BUW8_9BACT|nr:PEP-CTERM sorting domain-containing protein [Mucisphaera calidilacus]QDU70747.1 hypothetical protein Pan265_05820 [Mucisphaera calidilacus]
MKQMKTLIGAMVTFGAFSVAAADVIPLYTEATVAELGDVFNQNVDAGDGVNDYGIEILDAITSPPSPFNDGNAMRMWDFYNGDKPELQGELANPLTGPFRVDFESFNASTNGTSKAIRFRMGNAGDSITSESRVAFSLSWQADKEITAKYENTDDEFKTDSTEPLDGVVDVTIVGNAAVSGNYDYTLFGETRSLAAQSYDVFIDGVLFNDDASKANGLGFTLLKASGNYDPAEGLQRFGLLGSSNGDVDPDVYFDNIILRTGDDIVPEPASLALLSVGALMLRRR